MKKFSWHFFSICAITPIMVKHIAFSLGIIAWIAGIVGFYLQLRTSGLSEATQLEILFVLIATGLIIISFLMGRELGLRKAAKSSIPEVIGFYSDYYDIKWDVLLRDARQVEIVVNYFDSWAKSNWESIVEIFRRNGTVSIFLTNPKNVKHVTNIKDKFPEHSIIEIKKRIWDTVKILNHALERSRPNNGELRVYFYDGTLNYAAIRINNEKVVYSAYEQFRQKHIGNPGILLDLKKSTRLRSFFDKEIAGFIGKSKALAIPSEYHTEN